MNGKMFRSIPISTKTILAKTNVQFDKERIFYALSKIAVEVDVKEWIRGKKDSELRNTLMQRFNVVPGTILSILMGENHAGTLFKKKREGRGRTHFRNCISAMIALEDKDIHFKMFNNGTFKLTGCKTDRQAEDAIFHYMRVLSTIEESTPLYRVNGDPEFTFKTVMINIRYNLGFNINRENLDSRFYNTEEFYSAYEPTINPCVNIKSEAEENPQFLKCMIIRQGEIHREMRPMESFPDKKSDKEHTFLVFHSGVVIQSGYNYKEMESKYQRFMKMISDHKKELRDESD